MSKSLGNLVFVDELLKTYDPRAIRLAIVAHHYREPWEWHDQLMPTAADRLARWQAAAADADPDGDSGGRVAREVRSALDDDLQTPAAIEAIDAAALRGEPVAGAAALLGVHL
jgi:L-cysteine:1D-myo-inositol 2-amino-2-deoxy-alpha-D-glucopyranoside ligase